jgi:hypothetical protein
MLVAIYEPQQQDGDCEDIFAAVAVSLEPAHRYLQRIAQAGTEREGCFGVCFLSFFLFFFFVLSLGVDIVFILVALLIH